MNARRPKRGSIVDAIKSGIAKRGFYIVPAPDQIPACRGDKKAMLERIHQFARDNAWQVTIHNGNGWLLFTTYKFPAAGNLENDLGRLTELLESSLRANRALSGTRSSLRTRE